MFPPVTFSKTVKNEDESIGDSLWNSTKKPEIPLPIKTKSPRSPIEENQKKKKTAVIDSKPRVNQEEEDDAVGDSLWNSKEKADIKYPLAKIPLVRSQAIIPSSKKSLVKAAIDKSKKNVQIGKTNFYTDTGIQIIPTIKNLDTSLDTDYNPYPNLGDTYTVPTTYPKDNRGKTVLLRDNHRYLIRERDSNKVVTKYILSGSKLASSGRKANFLPGPEHVPYKLEPDKDKGPIGLWIVEAVSDGDLTNPSVLGTWLHECMELHIRGKEFFIPESSPAGLETLVEYFKEFLNVCIPPYAYTVYEKFGKDGDVVLDQGKVEPGIEEAGYVMNEVVVGSFRHRICGSADLVEYTADGFIVSDLKNSGIVAQSFYDYIRVVWKDRSMDHPYIHEMYRSDTLIVYGIHLSDETRKMISFGYQVQTAAYAKLLRLNGLQNVLRKGKIFCFNPVLPPCDEYGNPLEPSEAYVITYDLDKEFKWTTKQPDVHSLMISPDTFVEMFFEMREKAFISLNMSR